MPALRASPVQLDHRSTALRPWLFHDGPSDLNRSSVKQFSIIFFLFRLNYSHPMYCVLQHGRFDMAQRRNLARRAIGRFLNYMTGVALRPVPLHLMLGRGFIQTLPPVVIGLAAETSLHCLDHVTRVGVQTHPARFLQRFEAKRRRRNLGLLIGGFAQISAKGAPKPLITKQRDGGRARGIAAIAETRAVTKDRDHLNRTAIGILFAQFPT